MTKIIIYTDGACSGNPGPGGWGVRIEGLNANPIELSGGAAETTNNRMELTAAIEAIKALATCEANLSASFSTIEIYTDSQYVRGGITEWLAKWKRKNWRTSNKKPVKNRDLWEQLDAANNTYHIGWHWVRGHDGHPGNERADELARRGMIKYL